MEKPDPRELSSEALYHAYRDLVFSIANQYKNYGVPLEDLKQEGMIGLILAQDSFDASLGNEFSTYATYWIKKYILTALDRERLTDPDIAAYEEHHPETRLSPPDRAEPELTKYLSSFPENERMVLSASLYDGKCLKEIAQEMGFSVEKTSQLKKKALRRLRSVISQDPAVRLPELF